MPGYRHIIAVDPGDTNNGFCYFKYDNDRKIADVRVMQILSPKGLSDILKVMWGIGQTTPRTLTLAPGEDQSNVCQSNPHNMFFVIENFRMDSNVRGAVFQWNELLTSQAIGKVKLCAEWMDAPVFMQEPTILAQARRWAPFKIAKGHIKDDHSAFLHGAHFMMSKKLINTTDQITFKGEEKLF